MPANPWPLREVTLKVLDVGRLVSFYEEFGCAVLERSGDGAILKAGEGFRLKLRRLENGRPRPALSAGLFHFAILEPDRATLGSFLRHAARHKWSFVGAADHLVSEALYFSDREDNGIEVYADRPGADWQWEEHRVRMATLPLDLDELAQIPGPEWQGFPAATRLGHMHLTVTAQDRHGCGKP